MVVTNNRETSRFEAHEGDQVAFLEYQRRDNSIVFVHTFVPDSLRGRGIAGELARAGLESARAEGLAIVAQCPVVREYLRKHPRVVEP
jgi:predicted GNAT family acetyltransferase